MIIPENEILLPFQIKEEKKKLSDSYKIGAEEMLSIFNMKDKISKDYVKWSDNVKLGEIFRTQPGKSFIFEKVRMKQIKPEIKKQFSEKHGQKSKKNKQKKDSDDDSDVDYSVEEGNDDFTPIMKNRPQVINFPDKAKDIQKR